MNGGPLDAGDAGSRPGADTHGADAVRADLSPGVCTTLADAFAYDPDHSQSPGASAGRGVGHAPDGW